MFLEDFRLMNEQRGSIEVICGSMFSGKTEELLRRLRRISIAQLDFLLVKPIIENRYHDDNVVSHLGNFYTSKKVENSSGILELWNRQPVVAIDEAQFLDDALPEVCSKLANSGVRVIVAGLDMDFKGEPFGPIPQLLAMAEYITKVHAICVKCGNLAQFSQRISNNRDLVELGANEKYQPVCRTCYSAVQNEKG